MSIRMIITGLVQGVGYRSWAKRKARGLSLTGWVKNRKDGSVEIVAQGDTHALETFISLCRQGPPVSLVRDVSIREIEDAAEVAGFEVVY